MTPSSARHILIVRSCDDVYKRPSPPQRTAVTAAVWLDSVRSHWPNSTSQIRMSPSLPALAKRRQDEFKWYGSQLRPCMNFLWPVIGRPSCWPVSGSQIRISPFLHELASFLLSGDHATHSTHCLWPVHVYRGVSVVKSHKRMVVSPEPLARCLPSGLKWIETTASAWPGIELVHLVTGFTTKFACGWYTILMTASWSKCVKSNECCNDCSTSFSLMKNKYVSGSSCKMEKKIRLSFI